MATVPHMSRAWVWPQIGFGWLPVWVLYVVLISSSHAGASLRFAVFVSLLSIAIAAALGMLVQRLTERVAWPHPFRLSFVGLHVAAAAAYAVAWQGITRSVQWMLHGGAPQTFTGRLIPSLVLGVWLYVMVAGVAYATAATERAARAEGLAARAQLAALRAQLNPHFLFNALHTVVHLIPREPMRAAEAAERVAGLLRTTIEEDRDVVSLAEEWAFVQRYLEVERIRFGDRLRIRTDIADDAATAALPSFALQTLVENAVRHGAAPNVEPTDIVITARTTAKTLTLTVRDTGTGAPGADLAGAAGTGLPRLRERMTTLYGNRARLDLTTEPGRGVAATLVIPREEASSPRGAAASVEAER
jgi:signal transduction histidine kinase